MAVLTRAQLERGVANAQRERGSRWAWGDWAVDVAGPIGERGNDNHALGKLKTGLAEVAANAQLSISELPSMSTLRQYRTAADAIPPDLRELVPTTSAGWRLAAIADRRKRLEVIERLADENPKGIVGVDAVERHLGRKPTRPTPEENGLMPIPEHPAEKVALAEALLEDEETAAELVESRSDAGRNVRRAVHEKDLTDMHARAEQLDQEALARALPLDAYVASMMVKLTEWTLDLHRLHPHLEQVTDASQRATVADKHRHLIEAAEQNVAVLDPVPGLPEQDVIEGTAK